MAKEKSHKAHVAPFKKDTVASFVKLIKEYPVVGAVDVENLPALQLGRMRQQLRGTVLVKMTKRRLLTIALEKAGKQDLIPHLKGMPALIFTTQSPFKLFKLLKKSKSKAPIKAGQHAPDDIVVPAGPTSFAPGPIIGELGSLKIKAGIENGKVAIKADAVVAREGDVVSAKLAGVLARLGIEPMEIGLNLTAVWEDGKILSKDVLDVDEDAFRAQFATAASWAFNLALSAGFPTSETTVPLLQAAHSQAYRLALARDVITDETRGAVLAKAQAQACALKKKVES